MAHLTLMTWNVRYFGHGAMGLRATHGGMQRIADAIVDLEARPDVIALQEVETRSLRGGMHRDHQLDRLLVALRERTGDGPGYRGLYYPAHAYRFGPATLYTTGLAVLVAQTVEVIEHNTEQPHDITWRRNGWSGLKQRRIAAHIRLRHRDGGRPLDLFNTHLSLPAFLEVGPHRVHHRMGYGSNQLAEVDNLVRFASDRREHSAVVVGDFNSLPGSPAYDAVLDAGWVDAYARSTGRDPDCLRTTGTAAFLHHRMHIDHVFSTPDLHWHGIEAHSVDDGPFGGLSDHAPKIGQLSLA